MRNLLSLTLLAALAGCVAPSAPTPAPARPIPPRPAPAPLPPPPAASSDWRDWAVTPGIWSYQRSGAGSAAVYGSAGGATIFSIRCEADGGRLVLNRAGASGTTTIRTSSISRSLSSASLPANDPLIDAMGYSRGRFIVENAPLPPLVLPAWPEVLRVAEDCRR